jgi:hypothetical protein
MRKSWDLFNILMEKDSGIHVDLGNDSRYAMKCEGNISFQIDSVGSIDAHDVLYVLGIKKNFLLVSFM